jgi:AcrR family transcriptional regulator
VATKPAVPRRGRPPRHNRGDILDAASEVLIFRGYEATRYSDVAEASGVPIASIQHHFPAIEVLRREALRHKVRAELSDLASHVRQIDDPWERIRHIVIRSVSLEPARRRGGWIVWLEYWRAAAHDPALAHDSEQVNEQWLDLITSCVADGVSAGMFHLDGTPREAATELHALLDGLGIRLAVDHPPQLAAGTIALLERAARRMLFRA